jgi:hypothetical protein
VEEGAGEGTGGEVGMKMRKNIQAGIEHRHFEERSPCFLLFPGEMVNG